MTGALLPQRLVILGITRQERCVAYLVSRKRVKDLAGLV